MLGNHPGPDEAYGSWWPRIDLGWRRKAWVVHPVGEQQIKNDLGIKCPVSRVIEDEYSIDLEGLGRVGMINTAGKGPMSLLIVGREYLVEGPQGGAVGDDISWSYDVREAIPG